MIPERPKIVLKKTPLEKTLNGIALLLWLGSFCCIGMKWPSMPARIPVHYTASGVVNGWGNKGDLFFLPIIGAFLWIGLTILERYPHAYNYISLTKENIKLQYKNAVMMLNFIKNICVIFISYVSWNMVQGALGNNIGFWDLPLFLIVLFGALGFFIYRSFRLQ